MTDAVHASIKKLNDNFILLTGREAFNGWSQPTPTSQRWSFGDGSVFTKASDAYGHMVSLVAQAATDPSNLPYPFDQELTPKQDLRLTDERIRRLADEAEHGYDVTRMRPRPA